MTAVDSTMSDSTSRTSARDRTAGESTTSHSQGEEGTVSLPLEKVLSGLAGPRRIGRTVSTTHGDARLDLAKD